MKNSSKMTRTIAPLPPQKLYNRVNLRSLGFKTTADISAQKEILAQDRALKSLEFGLGMKSPAYNIYVAGLPGTGKGTTVRSYLTKIAPTGGIPSDWCYVNNFKSPENPIALTFPAGKGKIFKKQMDDLIESLKQEIPAVLESKDYENRIKQALKWPNEEKNRLFDEITKKAEGMGFSVKTTKVGIVTIPILDTKLLSEREYNQLPEDKRKEIEGKRTELEPLLSDILKKIRKIDDNLQEEIRKIQRDVVLFIVKQKIDDIRDHYTQFPAVLDHLNQIQENILDHLDIFKKPEGGEEPLHMLSARKKFTEFSVNLVVDNSTTQGAPVVFETNPTYYNLLGKIEKSAELGVYTTDFTKIKAGSIARANGGYLIINALDLLRNFSAWDVLKRCIKNKQISIEDLGEQYSLFPTSGLRPQPIPLHVKVILMGSSDIYHLLYDLDEEFHKIFKVRVDFHDETEMSKKNISALIRFIAYRSHADSLKHFDRSGVERLIEYSSRLAQNQEKLTLRMSEMNNLLLESHYWAAENGKKFVTREDVERAIEEKIYRSNLLEEVIQKNIEEGKLFLDTAGEVIGQINGLSIYSIGDYQFCRPTRITAQTFLGKSGVINIEREAKLSGKIHDKGVLILSGYIGAMYSQKTPLSVSATLCFEQSYGMIEGDSASAAELYCILSSIAEVPIRQDIAITGSMNQRGEIQPIGAVNEKIEGFFYTCKARGLTGRQGVIIPYPNVSNLLLRQEVIKAVQEKKFHIYAISRVDEGIPLLMGMTAGKRGKDGTYPKGTLHNLVVKKLYEFSEHLKHAAKDQKSQTVGSKSPDKPSKQTKKPAKSKS